MKKTLIILILVIGALAYFGIIDFNPQRTKEVLKSGSKAAVAQVKKVDKEKIKATAKQVTAVTKEVAQEAKAEYQAQ